MAIASEIQQQVYDLLSRSSNLSIVAAEPVETALAPGQQVLSLAPGQRVTAEVTGQPQAGKIPVQIGQQQLNLDLQMTVRQGQNLELTFVGNDPRPTFAITRPDVQSPPISLSDASRLLSMLVSNEQFMEPHQRSSLQSIGDLLRQSSGESSVLASFIDDFLTYRTAGRSTVIPPGSLLEQPWQQVGEEAQQPPGTGQAGKSVTAFEDAASKLLFNLAQRARLTLVDVANQPLSRLPLQPGDEANALVQGRLPGGRVLVQLAGESLELQLSKPVVQGEILRLALVTQQPKLVFALLGQPVQEQPSNLSEAARWLNTVTIKEQANNEVQNAVMARLQQVVSSLPPGSSALAAIMDEAMVYGASAALSARSLQNRQPIQTEGKLDEGVLKLLQSLMQGNRLALVEPSIQGEILKGFKPGQQLKGEVLQSLGGNRFIIQVGEQALEVMLPKGFKQGERLNLFFVGEEPPTFLLVRYGKGGDALVSQTGKWLSTLLGMQNQSARMEEGLGIIRTLLQGAPSDPSQLEQMLARGLKDSGLFYESHLSKWFSGSYPIERLLQEPQGRLSMGTTVGQEAQEAASKATKSTLQSPDGTDPRTMTIVREQLATLQTGQLLFQGELFPGQQMEWRIKDREGRGNRNEEGDERPWETSIKLTLPRLGEVEASLNLKGAHLDMQIVAGSEKTATLMNQELFSLQEQLIAAGLEPGKIVVKNAE